MKINYFRIKIAQEKAIKRLEEWGEKKITKRIKAKYNEALDI